MQIIEEIRRFEKYKLKTLICSKPNKKIPPTHVSLFYAATMIDKDFEYWINRAKRTGRDFEIIMGTRKHANKNKIGINVIKTFYAILLDKDEKVLYKGNRQIFYDHYQYPCHVQCVLRKRKGNS